MKICCWRALDIRQLEMTKWQGNVPNIVTSAQSPMIYQITKDGK